MMSPSVQYDSDSCCERFRRSQLPSPHEPRGDKKEKKRSKDEKREKTPKSDKKQKKDKRDKREGKSKKPALSIEDTGPEAAADASRSLREVADTTVHSSQARAYSPAKPPMHRGHNSWQCRIAVWITLCDRSLDGVGCVRIRLCQLQARLHVASHDVASASRR